MPEIERTSTSWTARMKDLTIGWELVTDRWTHWIEIGGPNGVRLRAVEGTAEDAVPASPAFQDLWLEEHARRGCEFQLMGQAGQAIFSAVVLVDEASGRLEFEICTRRKRRGSPVGTTSRYRFEGAAAGDTGLGDSRDWIRALPLPGRPDEELTCRIVRKADEITVESHAGQDQDGGREVEQIRWRYAIGAGV